MTVDIGSILQPMLVTLIQVLTPIIMAFIVLFLNKKLEETRGLIDAEKLAVAQELITRFVQAAQQSGLQGFIANEGSEKKNAVIAWTKSELARRGITLDLNTLDAMIEAIVFEQITQVKIFEAPAETLAE